jgi:hypothetical protein
MMKPSSTHRPLLLPFRLFFHPPLLPSRPPPFPPFSPPLLTSSVRLLFHELEDIDLARALDTFRSFNPTLGSNESQSDKDSSREEKLRERRSSDEGGGGKGRKVDRGNEEGKGGRWIEGMRREREEGG